MIEAVRPELEGRAFMSFEETSLIALFAEQVPEIGSGRVEIKAVARRAGYRSKVAVQSRDPAIDCIAACVGVRGFRIKNIVDALGGERVDLVRWEDSPERLIGNALQPAVIEKTILHSKEHRAVVLVRPDQVSLIQGRYGLNRELASQLSGWQIDVEET